ncbi:ParB N-terminal domain-containing protein, partial [Frankia sp. AgW1.1]|uniref:ParB N-terminal domain-containing protein n=1 Tax=Frankia sp. AgW1.1 TaxID=1836971 RepID=UPI00193251C8
MTEESTRMPSDVIVKDRFRRDLGDLSNLVESIGKIGLLHPPTVRPDNVLLAGERRLRAWQRLYGDSNPIPVRVVSTLTDARSLLVAERDENTCRKEMALSELVALGEALRELEQPKAKERMREGGARGAEVTNKIEAGCARARGPPPDSPPRPWECDPGGHVAAAV